MRSYGVVGVEQQLRLLRAQQRLRRLGASVSGRGLWLRLVG